MSRKTCTLKENGEKLLRLYLDEAGGVIRSVRLSGDFFMHPEEGVSLIERALEGLQVNEDEIIRAVTAAVERHSIQLVGISPGTIAQAILRAE
jgi:lipoate-protein ligase A